MTSKPRKQKVLFHHHEVVAHGLFSNPELGTDRFIPVVGVDLSQRADVRHYLACQIELEKPGDVAFTWKDPSMYTQRVVLGLEFSSNISTSLALVFHRTHHLKLIEGILAAEGFYLQHIVKGELIVETIERPKVRITLPGDSFLKKWQPIAIKTWTKNLRKTGLSNKLAQKEAIKSINQRRDLFSVSDANLRKTLMKNLLHFEDVKAMAVGKEEEN